MNQGDAIKPLEDFLTQYKILCETMFSLITTMGQRVILTEDEIEKLSEMKMIHKTLTYYARKFDRTINKL